MELLKYNNRTMYSNTCRTDTFVSHFLDVYFSIIFFHIHGILNGLSWVFLSIVFYVTPCIVYMLRLVNLFGFNHANNVTWWIQLWSLLLRNLLGFNHANNFTWWFKFWRISLWDIFPLNTPLLVPQHFVLCPKLNHVHWWQIKNRLRLSSWEV
jgi:hypothetical protein